MKTLGVMHMLLVQDMERSIAFYKNVFGCRVLQQSGFWSNLDTGHGKIALCTFGNKTELEETSLIIEIDDRQATADLIAGNGGKVVTITDPYEGAPVYNVIFIDPENNRVCASQSA